MNSPQTQTKTDETPAIVGGLIDGAPANPVTSAAPAVTAVPEAAKKKFILHGREFETADAALAYAEGITAALPTAPNTQAAPAVDPTIQRRKPSEILFENPDEAIALIKQELKQEIRQEDDTRTHAKNEWEQFYSDNPDLKGFEDEVEIQRQKNLTAFKRMPLPEAKRLLATETRARLAKIRGSANQGEQLSSKPATVAGSSGLTPPATPAAAPAAMSFIDEFKQMQSKRGKKVS